MRSLLGRLGLDAVIVVLALAAVIEAWVDSDETSRLVTVPFALGWTLPLLLHRRFPLLAPVIVFVVLAVETFVSVEAVTDSQTNTLAILAAFATAGAHPDVRAALVAAAIGYGLLGVIMSHQAVPVAAIVFMVVFAAACWGIGRFVSERSRRTADLEQLLLPA